MLDLKERGITSIYGSVAEMQVSTSAVNSANSLIEDFEIIDFLNGN